MASFVNLSALNHKKSYATEQLSVTTGAAVSPTSDKVNNVLTGTAVMTTTSGASQGLDRKSTRLNSSHIPLSRMPSSA